MADPTTLSTLTSMQPGTVSAYGDILKTIMAMNPVLGGVITLIGAFFVNKSAKKVTTTADAKGATSEDLAKFKTDLEKISADALLKFDALGKSVAERIEKSHKDTVQALDGDKIKAMRLNDNLDKKIIKLSQAQSVSEAVEQRLSRLEKVHAEFIKRLERKGKK